MEVIIVLAIAAVVLAVVVVGVGSAMGRSRRTDELESERGADAGSREGMGGEPVEDRPAGPAAESQDPATPGEMHPPEQRGAPADEVAPPSEAAGRQQPDDRD
jgi:hypothetical protein